MDDFIHNLRMGKNRPNDRKRRHYDHAKFKGNAPPSSRAKKGPSGRNFTPENFGQVKKTLDEIAANQKRLIEIAEKAADALETIAAAAAGFCAQGRQGILAMSEVTEEVVPKALRTAPSPKEAATAAPERSRLHDIISTMRRDGASYESIARHLTTEGIPTVSGRGKWRGQAVQRLYQQTDEDRPPEHEET